MPKPLNQQTERYEAVRVLVEAGHAPSEIYRRTGVTPPVVVKWFPGAGAHVPAGTWKDVPGWPEYAVTPEGLIRANEKVSSSGRRLRARLLRPTAHPNYGHHLVFLTRNGKTVTRQLARLVLETFEGPPPSPDLWCLHGDGNPYNNHVSNLRWGTRQDNIDDMIQHGTARRKNCKRGHPFTGLNVRRNKNGSNSCVACSREHQRALRQGRPFSEEKADSAYDEIVQEETRMNRLKTMVDDQVPLSEIMRTLKIDHRTVHRYFPGYKVMERGEGNHIRAMNQMLQKIDKYGTVDNTKTREEE